MIWNDEHAAVVVQADDDDDDKKNNEKLLELNEIWKKEMKMSKDGLMELESVKSKLRRANRKKRKRKV